MLNGWRVLDLTDHRGEVGPYLLADLGADVVRLVPGADTNRPPDAADPHRELAYNAHKHQIELTGDPVADRATVLSLVATSDLVFDSGPPGRLSELSLSATELVAANPRLVLVLITPFGSDGPRARQPASELTIAALGGSVRLQGTRDRAPVQMSVPQVWRHAGAEAALAALVAHQRMLQTEEPQFVDVSAQSVVTWTLLNAMEAHAVQGREFERNGSELHLSIKIQLRLDALDGFVVGVPTARLAGPLLPWLLEDGIVGPEWADIDWSTFDARVIGGEETEVTMAEVAAAVMGLCRRYDRSTLFHRGLTYGATLAPLNTVPDLLAFDHLEARGFWVDRPMPGAAGADGGSGRPLRFPGGFVRIDGHRPDVHRSGPGRASEPATTRRPVVIGGNGHVREPGLPFEGLKVVDFSWIGVGPITAKALADHGATVVRVESENRLDGLRNQPPYADDQPGLNRSNFFGTFNTSKLGLGLDLKNPAGRDVARRLIDWADVVIEAFTPGTFARLGLGYDEVAADHPELIMVSTSLLGPGSPVASMAGYGYHAAAIAGFQELVGWPDLPPDGPWLAYTDTIGPRFIATTILAALARRRATGRGSHIDAAQLEIALQFLAPELLEYQLTGEAPERLGNRDRAVAPQGVYPCRGHDRWLALTVTDDDAWQRLVEAMGRPAWALDPALTTVDGRRAAHDSIDTALAAWTAGWDAPELEACLAGAGVPAGVVQSSEQLLADPQYRHRRFYRTLDHAEVGPVPYAGHQYRIAGYDHGPRWAAPCLGQHTFEVLTEVLGMSVDEVADLAATGALS